MMYGEADIDEEPVAAFLGSRRKHSHAQRQRQRQRQRQVHAHGEVQARAQAREEEQRAVKADALSSSYSLPLSLSASLRSLLSAEEGGEGERQHLTSADVMIPESDPEEAPLSAGQLLFASGRKAGGVEQREAELLFLWNKVRGGEGGGMEGEGGREEKSGRESKEK